jgi:hypothetical protein
MASSLRVKYLTKWLMAQQTLADRGDAVPLIASDATFKGVGWSGGLG